MTTENAPSSQDNVSPVAIAIVVAIVATYAALSYYSDSNPSAVGLATALSLGPLLLVAAVLLWRWVGRPLASVIIVAGGLLLFDEWAFLKQHYQWSNLLQQCGAYALAALGFARSLWAGRVPLCTHVLEKLHGPLTALEIAYTRWATVAWATFYALLTIAVLLFFLGGPLRIWSLFTNFGTYALIALMFGADHLARACLLPRRAGGGVWAVLRQLLGGA
jgi:uncharacterized membrane protein